jgi:nicotinate-nucleotide adenylyltransferase
LPRPGAAAPVSDVLNAFPKGDARQLITLPAGRRLMFSAPNLDVSSSAVRRALAERGQCPALDEDVLAHIHRHGLYTVPDNACPDDEDS